MNPSARDVLWRRCGGGYPGVALRARLFRTAWKRGAWRTTVRASLVVKRAIDIAGALVALVCLAPLLLVVAALIKLEDGGPILYWQTRVGQWGRPFAFPKFRSMVLDAERRLAQLQALNDHGSRSVTFKMKRDPRITPVGRVIRKLSIDELPQLWLVLTGDLSLVGPRPPVPAEVARYSLLDRRRLHVKPGLTCIWQVNGRSEIPFDQQVELDVHYIQSASIWLDVKLLLRTVPAVLLGRGAY